MAKLIIVGQVQQFQFSVSRNDRENFVVQFITGQIQFLNLIQISKGI